MTHAINLNTNLLSVDITRLHTQMRAQEERKRAGKNEERQRVKKLEKKEEKKRKCKKEINE